MRNISLLYIALLHLANSHSTTLFCMEKQTTITNYLQLLPIEIHNKIAQMMINLFLKSRDIEFKKQTIFTKTSQPKNSPENNFGSITLHPHKKIVAITTENSTQLLDIKKQAHLYTFPIRKSGPSTIIFSAYGDKIGILETNKAIVWDGKTYKKLWKTAYRGAFGAIAFNPITNDFAIATAEDGIFIWDTNKNTLTHHLENGYTPSPSLAFNSTGDKIVIASGYTIKIKNIQYDKSLYFFEEFSNQQAKPLLACSTKDKNKIIAATTLLNLSDVKTGHHEWSRHKFCHNFTKSTTCNTPHYSHLTQLCYNSVAINPQGILIAFLLENGDIHLWDTITAALIDEYPSGKTSNVFPPIINQNRIAFSPDGRMLAIAFENTYELWHKTNRSKEWLHSNVNIFLAAIINKSNQAKKEGTSYALKEGSVYHQLFTLIPDYVQDFLRHHCSIRVIPLCQQAIACPPRPQRTPSQPIAIPIATEHTNDTNQKKGTPRENCLIC